MNFSEIVQTRRSIRKYKNKEIEEDKLRLILEAGRLAPSAKNSQDWKFIVVKDKLLKEKIALFSFNQEFIKEADVVIIAVATETERIMACGQYAYTVNLSIAMSFMICQAWELGIGSCWIGAFDEEKIKDLLKIPNNYRIVALSPFGYPDENPPQRKRKSLEEIISYDYFN